jgi:NIPSNAP
VVAQGVPKDLDSPGGELCCQVLELRQYLLHSGRRKSFIELFERQFIESQEALGMRVVGQFRVREQPDLFLWIRGFADMASRAHSLKAFYEESAAWRQNRDAANAAMIDSDNVLLLRPAGRSRGFPLNSAGRPDSEASDTDGGLLVAEVHSSDRAVGDEFFDGFETDGIPLLRRAGMAPLAYFVTEPAINTYPRLPVREGEHLFVWFTAFPDRAAYRTASNSLREQGAWDRTITPQFAAAGLQARQVLELEPTRRSLLRAR